MRDIDELRQALDVETAHLTVTIEPDQIRRRARGLRTRRLATMTVVGMLALGGIAGPTIAFTGAPNPFNIGRPPSSADPSIAVTCQPPPPTAPPAQAPLGPFADTGVVIDAPNLGRQFTVEFGLRGDPTQPGYIIAFRDRQTGTLEDWVLGSLLPGPGGFRGKREGDPALQFLSYQLVLGPNKVLDLGIYAHAANRITIASEGRATNAQLRPNAETGWTLFWAVRDAAPLPVQATTATSYYDGPERLTLTAYGADGNELHTTTMGLLVGGSVQNPRDNSPQPDPRGDPTPTPAPASIC